MGRNLHFKIIEKDEDLKSYDEGGDNEKNEWIDELNKIWSSGISRHNDLLPYEKYLTIEQLKNRIIELSHELENSNNLNKLDNITEAVGTLSYILHEALGSKGACIRYH